MRRAKRISLSVLLGLLSWISLSSMGVHTARAREPFPVLPGLETTVQFWKQVFTKYGKSQIIFFDPTNPTRIYQVVEAGEGRRARRQIRIQRSRIMRRHGLKSRRDVRSQRGIKERFRSGLERSGRYLKQMQDIFREEDLPVELAYLPLIESSFQIRARSHAGAVGVWQFMRTTGRRFLRIDSRIDERRDPMDATRAAAQLLKESYGLFGNWPLSITAYNHGQQGIGRAVKRVGSRDLMKIIRHYENRRFGFSSKNFYAEFLAALQVAQNAEEFFPDIRYEAPSALEELELKEAVSLPALLSRAQISQEEFLSWNPAVSRPSKVLPAGYRVKVPRQRAEMVAAAYRKIIDQEWTRHQVARGETLWHIARAYRITVRDIQLLNNLTNAHLIIVGQQLKIPKD